MPALSGRLAESGPISVDLAFESESGSILAVAGPAGRESARLSGDMGAALEYVPEERVVLIVGNYGSGKTEVAVNLAIQLCQRQSVSIADLDIVNPYFRCREARAEMEGRGIRVINPQGDYHAADLPIILPEVRGEVLGGTGVLKRGVLSSE